jgi:tryptophanyl-tRNA synthetase
VRVLSGIQPSGKLHLGNYFGAMKQHLELQHEHECFYFIANYHALTSVQDARLLEELTHEVAVAYLALGLDPNKAVFFRQSDVPQVTELSWILATVTGKGLLERAHSYKDKIAKGIMPSMGLFNYPILMAADILIYRSQLVPVGQDQVQHIEMTQDIAGYFNSTYGCELLVRPEPKLNDAAVVAGTNGQKMSKSYDNTIEIFAEPKVARQQIMSIKTDSTPVAAPKDPAKCNVYALLRLMASPAEAAEWAERYRKGGVSYAEVKKRLCELHEELFGAARSRRAELVKDTGHVQDVLREGGRKARAVAEELMQQVRRTCGLVIDRQR